MKLASKRFVPEILLALSLVMCVVLGALCHSAEYPRLLAGAPRDDAAVVAAIATVFAVLPVSVYIVHKLKKVHNSEQKDVNDSES